MSIVAERIRIEHCLLDIPVSSKKRVFEQVSYLFENSLGIAASLVFDSLFAREKLGSTGLGLGVALPHGRIKGIKDAQLAFVRLQEAIPFDAPDGKPVKILFVLLVPKEATNIHLQLLSELAQLFGDKIMREFLLTESSPESLVKYIQNWRPYHATN